MELSAVVRQPADDDQRQSHFTVDLELMDDEGKTLAVLIKDRKIAAD